MLDGSYSGLQASIADFIARTDLTATIPDFIAIAEADLNRKLRTRLMQTLSQTTVSATFVNVPADFAGVVTMFNANGQPMSEVRPDAIAQRTYEASTTSSNVPLMYAVAGGTFQFWPLPSVASPQVINMTYYQRIPPLKTNPTGNWLSLAHPDAYLLGSLTAAAPFLQDMNMSQLWPEMYSAVVDSILMSDRRDEGMRLTPQPSRSQII